MMLKKLTSNIFFSKIISRLQFGAINYFAHHHASKNQFKNGFGSVKIDRETWQSMSRSERRFTIIIAEAMHPATLDHSAGAYGLSWAQSGKREYIRIFSVVCGAPGVWQERVKDPGSSNRSKERRSANDRPEN
jgi:hypothetical protein